MEEGTLIRQCTQKGSIFSDSLIDMYASQEGNYFFLTDAATTNFSTWRVAGAMYVFDPSAKWRQYPWTWTVTVLDAEDEEVGILEG